MLNEKLKTWSTAVSVAKRIQNPPHLASEPWPIQTTVWSRIYIDFVGTNNGIVFLVIVLAHSK